MKKLSKPVALAIGIATVFIAGCSNITGTVNSDAIKTESTDKSAKKTISLDVTSDGDIIDFSDNSARTIVPSQIAATDLYYYLDASSEPAGQSETWKEVKFEKSAASNFEGTTTVDITPANYKFTLYATTAKYATQTAAETANAVALKAYANADLRYSQRVRFYMSADNVNSQITGNASLALYATDKWKFTVHPATNYTINAYIENIDSNTEVATTRLPITAAAFEASTAYDGNEISPITSATTQTAIETKKGIAYIKTGLPSGTYNFVVSILDTTNSKTYYYSDRIIILPGQTTCANVAIPPIVDYAPAMPSKFTAGYLAPATKDTLASYYNVGFEWTDNADNEQYYKLEIAEIADTATNVKLPEDDAAITSASKGDAILSTATANDQATSDWGNISTTSSTTYDYHFYGQSGIWVYGSLNKNNTKAVARLQLGKRYMARIQSYNAAGSSAWSYVTFGAPTIDSNTYVAFEKTTSNYGTINLFRLAYYENKGTWNVTSPYTKPTLISYVNQDEEDGIEIIAPDGFKKTTSGAAHMLSTTNSVWTNWKKDSLKGTDYPLTPTPTAADDPALASAYVAKAVYYSDATCTTVATKQPTTVTEAKTGNNSGTYYVKVKECDSYTDFKDLSLYASYDIRIANVTIYSDNDYEMDSSDVTISVNSKTGETGSIKPTDDSCLIFRDKLTNTTTTWTYTLQSGIEYDLVKFTITKQNGGIVYNGTIPGNGTIQFNDVDVGPMITGKYIATFYGYRAQRPEAPYTVSVYLTIND